MKTSFRKIKNIALAVLYVTIFCIVLGGLSLIVVNYPMFSIKCAFFICIILIIWAVYEVLENNDPKKN